MLDASRLTCDCLKSAGPNGFPAEEASCYVTILLEPRDYNPASLPLLQRQIPHDIYAVAPRSLSTRGAAPVDSRTLEPRSITVPFPFAHDFLAEDFNLRCGNCTVTRSGILEEITGTEQVFVVDMGAYRWSGTLKDPRSWAILNVALAAEARQLAIWTAGNAGLSIARLVYAANRFLAPEQRIQVYAIVDSDVAPEIRTHLKLWQCEVLDIFRGDKPILAPDEVRNLVSSYLRRSRRQFNLDSYWNITNGRDGVGLLMYRYLAAQIIRGIAAQSGSEQPLYIVLPVGTGDLLLGFHLGILDCEAAGLIGKRTYRLVGVLPAGDNILSNIRQRSISSRWGAPPIDGAEPPVMPKLLSSYTPLAPCLALMELEKRVRFVTVSASDQLRAGRYILTAGIDDGLPCEPSALSVFAALPQINAGNMEDGAGEPAWAYQSSRRILVVNSGFGIVGHDEELLLRRAIGM